MIDEKVRIRIVRVLLGMNSRQLAATLGVSPQTITAWEKGRATPQRHIRTKLSALCLAKEICFLPSGMPVPREELKGV